MTLILESRTLASLLKSMASFSIADPIRNLPRHSETKPGGQERVTATARLARLNLAVHGLSGDIKQGNTYYEDLQDSVGSFARSQCLIFNGKP